MLKEILTLLGLLPDPSELAGRPDRDMEEEVEFNYEGTVRWGPEYRLGIHRGGDYWGEWELTEPKEVVGESFDPPSPTPG